MGGEVARRIIIYHAYYGCDTGCCGHVVEVDDQRVGDFNFDHPWGRSSRAFAEELVTKVLGAEHVKDLDWENCEVISD